MSNPPKGPVIIEYDDAPKAAPAGAVTDVTEVDVDPANAPPVPDATGPAPEGRAMVAATRIAAKRMGWFGRLVWAAITGLVLLWIGTAAWDFAAGLISRNVWLGWGALVLGAIVAIGVLGLVIRELSGFARLDRLDRIRKRAEAARTSSGTKASEALQKDLVSLYRRRDDMAWAQEELAKHQTAVMDGADRLDLLERTLMAPLDARARVEIETAARQVAMVTAVVPMPLADVLAALFANVRMVRAIAEVYGGRAGSLGSWRLIRTVATHLIATGAVGVADDMISTIAGGGALAKVSRRFGEGVINGALTARVGVAAMDVCRPMPFVAENHPTVTSLMKSATTGLFSSGE